MTLDELLSIDDVLVKPVPVPEWGGKIVHLARPSAARKDAFDRSLPKTDKGEVETANWRGRTVALCLSDEAGNFIVADPADAVAIGDKLSLSKGAKAIQRLFDVAADLCGMIADKDAEKN